MDIYNFNDFVHADRSKIAEIFFAVKSSSEASFL
jgi:hypothetical protein